MNSKLKMAVSKQCLGKTEKCFWNEGISVSSADGESFTINQSSLRLLQKNIPSDTDAGGI